MRFTTFVVAAMASMVAAQSATQSAATSTATSKCAAQNILDACIGTIQGQVNSCGQTDYSCLCEAYKNMLTCYNNCPGDLGVSTVQSQRQQYCSAASVYASTTSYAASLTATHSALTTNTDSAAASGFATASDSGSATGTSSSSSETSSGAASCLKVAGSFMAVVALVSVLHCK